MTKIVNPFRIDILSKRDMHPLQAASIYSGEKMFDIAEKKEFSPLQKASEVVHQELIFPSKDSDWYEHLPPGLKLNKNARSELVTMARNSLWLKVNIKEKRDDSQFARLFQLELPVEVPVETTMEWVNSFAQKYLTAQGMICDASIHQQSEEGVCLHQKAFLMTTVRAFENSSFATKNRAWNDKETLRAWRCGWFNILRDGINLWLEKNRDQEGKMKKWLDQCNRYTFAEKVENDAEKEITKEMIQGAFMEKDGDEPSEVARKPKRL